MNSTYGRVVDGEGPAHILVVDDDSSGFATC